MNRRHNNDGGYVLLGVLVLISLALIISAGMLENSAANSKTRAIVNTQSDYYYAVEETLNRVVAWLQRRTGLPLYVSAGSLPDESPPLGELMQRVLEQELLVPVKAAEVRSRTTGENARYTARLLKGERIDHIFLVSHAWHLPRAVEAFEQAGLQVTPAPTAFVHRPGGTTKASDFVPTAQALIGSRYAIHEYLGRAWYALKDTLKSGAQ